MKASCLGNCSCGFLLIHLVHFSRKARSDRVALEFAVHSQQAVFDCEWLRHHVKASNLLVVGKINVHGFNRGLNARFLESICRTGGNKRGKKAALIAQQHNLLSFGQSGGEGLLERLRRDVMARIENDEVLDAAGDPPIAARVRLALIARMKPASFESFLGFGWPLPVARKHVRSAHEDFTIFRERHFHSGNRWTDAAGNYVIRVVHGANRGGFGKAVNLKNRNSDHHEKELGVEGKRSRSAEESLQVLAYTLANRGKHNPVRQRKRK